MIFYHLNIFLEAVLLENPPELFIIALPIKKEQFENVF
jgi:hypothetical protein